MFVGIATLADTPVVVNLERAFPVTVAPSTFFNTDSTCHTVMDKAAASNQQVNLLEVDQQRGHGNTVFDGAQNDEDNHNTNPHVDKSTDNRLDNSMDELCCILKLQALLNQFSHPKEWADFMNHKFNFSLNPNLLGRLTL